MNDKDDQNPQKPRDYGENPDYLADDPLSPLNIKKDKKGQKKAVALEDRTADREVPKVIAAGKGKIAEQILQLADENDIRVREDKALTEMLSKVELDSPIPSEAFMAIAEILTYVYRANGEPNPFDAILEEEYINDKD